jgi:hypothetical protein
MLQVFRAVGLKPANAQGSAAGTASRDLVGCGLELGNLPTLTLPLFPAGVSLTLRLQSRQWR